MTISSFVFLNSSQAFVFGPFVQGVNESEWGSASGQLSLYDEILSVFALALWGIVSDRLGRKVVYASGLLLMALGLVLYPQVCT